MTAQKKPRCTNRWITPSSTTFIEGFSLHAATRVMASDRRGLWRLCAYGARGAVASSRLSELPDGRFAYQYRWSTRSRVST
jgi:hypothetical protein